MTYKVYMHTSPEGKKYIGITCQTLELRWRGGQGYKKNDHFARAILKFGWENFKHDVVEDGLSEEDAKLKEIELIKLYKSHDKRYGYNLDLGGNSGHRFTEESKMKMSLSSTGKKHSAETIQKIRQNGKGLKRSDETRRKMSEAWSGVKNHRFGVRAYNAKKVQQLTLDGLEIQVFDSSYDAEKKTGVKSRSIRSVCGGDRKSTGGFRWRFYGV